MSERGQQIIRILKGLNLDLAPEFLKDQATFLKNCISDYNWGETPSYGQAHNVGVITPAEGAILIGSDDSLPSGQNLCIGARYDRRLNQFFFFVWNSNGDHSFWLFDCNDTTTSSAGTYYKIFQSSLFNFSPRNLITSIDIVLVNVSGGQNVENLQRLVYFTEGLNNMRKMNVDVALAGGYAGLTHLRTTDEFMNLMKYPPLDIDITSTLPNPDPSYLLNFVYNKQFKFRARYFYQDGEHSTAGAISTLAYNLLPSQNFIELSLAAGSSLVTYVLLDYQFGNVPEGDWRNFRKISRADIVANVIYPYNNTTNIFIYKFFGNEEYNVLDQSDENRLFDFVPIKAFAQGYVEENVLLTANILEGYNNFNPTELAKPTFTINYLTFAPLTLTITGHMSYTFNDITQPIVIEILRYDASAGLIVIEHTYTINSGDPNPVVFNVAITDIDFGDIVYAVAASAGAGNTLNGGTFVGTYTHITSPVTGNTGNFGASQINTQVLGAVARMILSIAAPVAPNTVTNWDTTLHQHTCPNFSTGIHQLKQGGKYRIDIIGYDALLRSTYVQTLSNELINIESIQQHSKFQTFTITINWNGIIFPDWVKYIKVCRTKNLNIDRSLGTGYLQFGITFDPATGFLLYDNTAGNPATDVIKKVKFTLSKLIQYNTDNFENTTTTYTWAQDDRVQFIRNGNGTYFDFSTFGLIDVRLSTDPLAPDVTFIADYVPALATLVNGAWVELYTPAKQPQNDIFYEIGNFLPTNGVASRNQLTVSTTVLTTFDTYNVFWGQQSPPLFPYVNSAVTDAGVTPFEHHSIYRDVVPSNGEDIGRSNVINVDAFQQWYDSRVRKSNAYIPNSFYNGLSTFRDDSLLDNVDKTDLNRANGGISQLDSNGYRLTVFQEDKVIGLMMAKQLVSLANGQQQLVTTDRFFSDPIIIQGEFGLQNSESFTDTGDMKYFADTKRGAFVEFDGEKLTDIAREGMVKSYSDYKLKAAQLYNNSEASNEKCCWDVTNFTHLSADWYINFLVNGAYTTVTASGAITTPTQLAALLNTVAPFNTSAQTNVIVQGNNLCFWGGTIEFSELNSIGSLLIFDDTDVFKDTLPIACSIDIITFPAGYNPKQKQYVQTFFNVNTKPHYAYNISSGFTTGDAVLVSISIDSNVQTTTTAINGLQDLQEALQTLIDTYLTNTYGRTFADSPLLIENNRFFYIISSSGSVYGNIVIGTTTYVHNSSTTQYQYVNNQYGIAVGGTQPLNTLPITYGIQMNRAETIAWSILNRNWTTFYAFCPEFFCFADGNNKDLAMISFYMGQPAVHNFSGYGFNLFYGFNSDQIIGVVCGEGATTEKRFSSISLDSKNKTSSITAMKYSIVSISTSDNQISNLPIGAFDFKENFVWAAFMRASNLGGNIVTGQQLRGKWIQCMMVRDTAQQTAYSELGSITIYFFTSEKAIR